LPTCAECGAVERPGVVWFGESLPEEPFELAIDAVSRARVLLVVGTSGIVQPAASLVEIGRARGATVIEVNPEAIPGGRKRIALAGPAGEVLPELVRLATRA
jgi:NAD-dependent deacetylase